MRHSIRHLQWQKILAIFIMGLALLLLSGCEKDKPESGEEGTATVTIEDTDAAPVDESAMSNDGSGSEEEDGPAMTTEGDSSETNDDGPAPTDQSSVESGTEVSADLEAIDDLFGSVSEDDFDGTDLTTENLQN